MKQIKNNKNIEYFYFLDILDIFGHFGHFWTFLDIFWTLQIIARFSKTRIWGFFSKMPYHRFLKKMFFFPSFLYTLGSPRYGFGVFFLKTLLFFFYKKK